MGMKIGVIGYGYWGKILTNSLVEQARVHSILVFDHQLMKAVAKPLSAKISLVNAKDFWSAPLDGIVITTPEETHFEIATRCLEHKIACFVEKPLALHLNEAEQLVTLAKTNQKALQVDQVFLHDEHFIGFCELVRKHIQNPTDVISYKAAKMIRPKNVTVIEDMWSHDLYQLREGLNLKPERIFTVTSMVGKSKKQKAAGVTITAQLSSTEKTTSKIAYHGYLSWRGQHKTRMLAVIDALNQLQVVWQMSEFGSEYQLWQKGQVIDRRQLSAPSSSPVLLMMTEWLEKLEQPWEVTKPFWEKHWRGALHDIRWLEQANNLLGNH